MMKQVACWWNPRTLKYATDYQREIFMTYISVGRGDILLRLGDFS